MGLFVHSIVAAAGYYALYLAMALIPPRGSDYRTPPYLSRGVSTVNAISLVFGVILFYTGVISDDAAAWVLQAAPIGYCVFDTFHMCAVPALFDRTMIIHHVAFAYFPAFVFAKTPLAVSLGYLSEITVPFLNVCWHHHHSGAAKGVLYRSSAVILLITFFCFRVCSFSGLAVWALVFRGYIMAGTAIGGLAALNGYWYCCLVSKARGTDRN
jgi:hypothetical protein